MFAGQVGSLSFPDSPTDANPYAWFDYNGQGWLTFNAPYTGNEAPNH